MSIRTFLSASISIFCASLLFRCDADNSETELSKNIQSIHEINAAQVSTETTVIEPSI